MLKTDDLTPITDARRLPSPERHMTITPLDMRQAKFAVGMRGFDKAEVTTFLEEAADGFEHTLRENERLRQEIVRLEASLNQFRELEGSLKTTLMSAQKVADDMRENALQEAARLVREAEGRSELILQRTQAKTEDIEREIDGLRIKRREAEASVESTIAALHNTLDFIREQDRREHEDRVIPHRPKIAVAGARPA
jgi:cell division initiation protein